MAIKKLEHRVVLQGIGSREAAQAAQWCSLRFGLRYSPIDNRQGRWCCFWLGIRSSAGGYEWFFSDEQDAVLFSLRWL